MGTKVESEESKCEGVIEKGEELKKEDSVEDVQQSEDERISVIDDYKKVEVEKNEVVKNNDMKIRKDGIIEKEEKEDVIDVNERVYEQETDDAEISVIDDCKNLEVRKHGIMEIKTDDEIKKEEMEDG